MHLETNNLGRQEIMIKHFFNCSVVGTILTHHYCFWDEYVFPLHNVFQNLIQQFPEETISHVDPHFTSIFAFLRKHHMARKYTNRASVL